MGQTPPTSKASSMKVLAWFSAGITSAVACKLAVQKFGIDAVDFYYIGIRTAHPDNNRFITECEKWYGKNITQISNSRFKDQFEVIEKTGYVNGVNGAACSTKLKKDVRYHLEQRLKPDLFNPDKPTIQHQIFGFEYSPKEINRAKAFQLDYSYTNPIFPLIENKLTKEDCAGILQSAGIELPAMYLLGYNNNNCIGCTKGGKGYWNKIRIDFPEHFARMAKAERVAGHSCINGTFLDELNPEDGNELKPIVPECSVVCEDILKDSFFDSLTPAPLAVSNTAIYRT